MTTTALEPLTSIANSRLGLSFSLVSSLKSAASNFNLTSGEQIHSLAIKSGLLHSNLFVSNALIHLYSRCGHLPSARHLFLSSALLNTASYNILLSAHFRCPNPNPHHARRLFDEMPQRDHVSFTTMIMGLAKHGSPAEALALFRDMMAVGITPNDVALASVVSSFSRLDNPVVSGMGRIAHALAVKCGIDGLILVATNLVHNYALCLNFGDAEAVFGGISEKNRVTWNVLLKGYAKARDIEAAKLVFERIPEKDVVSWGTMINGYLLADCLEGALFTFCEMLEGSDARPNEVMLVNLVSFCSLCAAICEGQQLHAVIVKAGLDCHAFVQATLIHLYSECGRMDLALLQFRCGSEGNVSSWNAVIGGFMQNNDLASAEQLFDEMPERDVVSWSTMIAGYAQHGKHEMALVLWRDMWSAGIRPNEITLLSVLSAAAGCSSLEEGKWVHDYINKNSVPLTDNVCAGLIDMYAKCGSIHSAIQLFCHVRETYARISSWNAIICGLAMHGHANASFVLFASLLKTWIKPNSITFLGVLSACCHAGLAEIGRKYFDSIESVYGLKPSIKHYGCMVDLLGRAGHLEEAEELIESMPMEADVVIWGSMLASARTHKKIEIGERSAEKLARLDPGHGAGRVLISNIYADAARWGEVCLVRRAIWSGGLKKEAGQSSVLSIS